MFHGAAFLFYSVLAFLWLHRLLPVWNSAIVGGLQDTRLFVWNVWWFRHAIDVLNQSPYHTSLLFHPYGSTLLTHDYPLWMSLVTYGAQHLGVGLIGSLNSWFVLSWVLAGFCTYLLVWEITQKRAPAIVAGLLVMTHSYTLARAMQNWGQFNLWGIALFLWLLVRARRHGGMLPFVLAGIALAWTAACHYYFLIYAAVVWLAVLIWDFSPWGVRMERRTDRAFVRLGFLLLAALAGGVGIWIVLFQPGQMFIGNKMISLKTASNPLLVMWLSLGAWWAARYRYLREPRQISHSWKGHAILVLSAALCLSPLVWSSLQLIVAGDYPKQSILWKTHLKGADVVSPFLPNPLHALWGGSLTQWFYERGMQPQEQAAMIGWVCLAVVLSSRIRGKWFALAIASTVFSLGTYLHVLNHNTWLPLPFYAWRLIPVLGNVRVPERWMSLGAIAWGVALALALVALAERKKKFPLRRWCLIVGALVLFENWPGLPLGKPPQHHPVFDTLRELPRGGVLPLPLYVGDSSVGTGDAPSGLVWEQLGTQIYHQQPMVGGYLGRISRQLIRNYEADAFIGKLLNIEEGEDLETRPLSPEVTCASMKQLQIRYVLLYPNAVRPTALSFAQQSIPLTLLERTPDLELYQVQCP